MSTTPKPTEGSTQRESTAPHLTTSAGTPTETAAAPTKRWRFASLHDYHVQTYSILLAAFLAMGYSTYQARESAAEARRLREEAAFADFSAKRTAFSREYLEWLSEYWDGLSNYVYKNGGTKDDYVERADSIRRILKRLDRRGAVDQIELTRYFGSSSAGQYAEATMAGHELEAIYAQISRRVGGDLVPPAEDTVSLSSLQDRALNTRGRLGQAIIAIRLQISNDLRYDRRPEKQSP